MSMKLRLWIIGISVVILALPGRPSGARNPRAELMACDTIECISQSQCDWTCSFCWSPGGGSRCRPASDEE